MPNHELLTDDYIAGLLTEEAKDCSLKYSSIGMEPKKEATAALKPNKRFLRNIIKNTEAHNKAKLAREEAQSKAKLQEHDEAREARRLRNNPDSSDIRKRQMGDIHAILGGTKRNDGGRLRHRHSDNKQDSRDGDKKRAIRDKDAGAGRHGREREDASSGPRDGRRQGRFRRGGSRDRERSRSPGKEKRGYRQRSRRRSPPSGAHGLGRSRLTADNNADDDDGDGQDTDPLDDLIGPAPPPRHRGRGTIGGAANLDRRFSESYDPRTDTQDYDVDEDWDEAAETFRDLAKLRLNQSQRLRSAGFSDLQIRGLAGRNQSKDKDVVWTKAGEERAWDQGKASH